MASAGSFIIIDSSRATADTVLYGAKSPVKTSRTDSNEAMDSP